jgi:N-acetyltransferase
MTLGPGFELPVLRNHVVTLEPLRPDHASELAAAAGVDRATYGFTWVPEPADGGEAWVASVLGTAHRRAFVVRHNDTGQAVGSTSFIKPEWWDWATAEHGPDNVEVGGTWYSPSVQRTAVNTACKRLMLGHAFDTWKATRVSLCTDARNDRSRAAIARLGAQFEGVLRQDRIASDGMGPRDTALFSIVSSEWPDVAARLDDWLAT